MQPRSLYHVPKAKDIARVAECPKDLHCTQYGLDYGRLVAAMIRLGSSRTIRHGDSLTVTQLYATTGMMRHSASRNTRQKKI